MVFSAVAAFLVVLLLPTMAFNNGVVRLRRHASPLFATGSPEENEPKKFEFTFGKLVQLIGMGAGE